MAIIFKLNCRITQHLIVFFLLVFLYNFSANVDACFSDDSGVKKLSNIHRDNVSISVDFSGEELDVVIKLPFKINGADLSNIFIIKTAKNSDDEVEFLFPLKIQKEGGEAFAWYAISRSMSDHNYIQASYGNGCGWLIEYDLDYVGEKLKLK